MELKKIKTISNGCELSVLGEKKGRQCDKRNKRGGVGRRGERAGEEREERGGEGRRNLCAWGGVSLILCTHTKSGGTEW